MTGLNRPQGLEDPPGPFSRMPSQKIRDNAPQEKKIHFATQAFGHGIENGPGEVSFRAKRSNLIGLPTHKREIASWLYSSQLTMSRKGTVPPSRRETHSVNNLTKHGRNANF